MLLPGTFPGADVVAIDEGRLDAALERLPGFVEGIMSRSGVPGVAVAVVRHLIGVQ
jgi:hypothetical protein